MSAGRLAALAGGLATLALASTGPLHEMAERALVSAHMGQHLLLTLVAAPLLLLGTPPALLGPVLRRPLLARAARSLTRPLPAFGLFTVVFTAWHVPALYEWALRDPRAHGVAHALFVGSALLFWCPVAGPLTGWRLAPPARLLYLFAACVPMVPVAAFLTLADEVLYPVYGDAAEAWGLTPLADQRLGGVLMWIGGPLVLLVAMTIVFFRWMGRDVEPAVAAPARGGADGAD